MAKPTIKVVEKNEGRKIGYELEGSTLWIGDAIAMRLPRLQTDDTVKKDICADADGNLVFGLGENYVHRLKSRQRNMSTSRERQTQKEKRPLKECRKILTFQNVL